MFGSHGLFAGEAMVGILHAEVIYLKTDEETRGLFLAEGCGPFVYRKRSGEKVALSYYQVPDRLYDEPEEFARWVRRAYAVAERSPAVRHKRAVLAPRNRSARA
jgi:DNA transformation protein and related proteins